MKGYTDFIGGMEDTLRRAANGEFKDAKMKYMDWKKVQQIVDEHPDSVIYAGLMEDWNNTSGLIYDKGKYHNGGYCFYGVSIWATPIVDVDGVEVECWTYDKTKEGSGMPKWWGKKKKVKK